VAFLCFVAPYTLLWAFVGPELPTLAGALFGGLLFIALLGRFGSAAADRPAGATVRASTVLKAAAPYLVLVSLVLLTRLVPDLRRPLQSFVLQWRMQGGFEGSMQPLYHPGTMLLLGFVVGALLQRTAVRTVASAVRSATRVLIPVAAALVAMLLLSRVMVHAGMTQALALAAAAGAGGVWPALAPFVGMLGTFVTGSATASNILFTDFQRETALALELPIVGVIGVQGFGAAVGNMVCPHNVVAAGATVGLEGREGEILRSTLGIAALYAGAGGLLALWLVG
jgi:lactate permease